MSYDQVNKFIEAMNLSYKAKYKVLKQKKSTLNDANRKLYEIYQRQETKDTKGNTNSISYITAYTVQLYNIEHNDHHHIPLYHSRFRSNTIHM